MKFKRLKDHAIMPEPAKHKGDAGMDLYVPENHQQIIPFTAEKIPLGIAWEAPIGKSEVLTPMLQITPRSSTAEDWGLLIQPGVIDAGYTGELKLVAINFTPYTVGVPRGCRLAQAVLHWVQEAPNKEEERGAYGFGSTNSITWRNPSYA